MTHTSLSYTSTSLWNMGPQLQRALPKWVHFALYLALIYGLVSLAACGGGDGGGYGDGGNGGGNGGGGITYTASVNGPSRAIANTRYSYQATVTGGTASGITWNWGDGTPDSSGAAVQKVWHKPGSFTAQLQALVYGQATPASQAVQVIGVPLTAGWYHTCALQPSGSVRCWGNNVSGQLGNGTAVSSTTSVSVTGLADAVSLASGSYHTCALRASGGVSCWGSNGVGQLGNGTTSSGATSTPVAVEGLTDAVALVAGGSGHSCALQAGGTVRCWGANGNGQLGDGTTVNSNTSVLVTGLNDAVALASGGDHTCALQSSGSVRCWGFNGFGQLGDGSTVDGTSTVAVSGLTDAVALAAGGLHTCALLASGSVQCWGYNGVGNVGNGTTSNSVASPAAVTDLTDAVALTANNDHTCAVQASGSVRCWGRNNNGQLGNGGTVDSSTGVAVTGLSDAVAVVAGFYHTCALQASGGMSCWGWNNFGQLGDGTTVDKLAVTALPDGPVFWK
jgi:alpha-tubulin suppressor-like RCC1 family protein